MGALRRGPMPERPINEMRFVAKTGFLSREIWLRFFVRGSDRWLRKKWAALRTNGLFEPLSKEHAPNVLVLTTKGKVLAKHEGFDPVTRPAIQNLKHDAILSSFLLELESLNLLQCWKAEAELERDVDGTGCGINLARLTKFPDAEIVPKASLRNQVLAVELELTLKSRKRYLDILNRYAGKKNLLGVLFIVGTENIRQALIETREKQRFVLYSLPVGVMRLSDWQEKKGDAPVSFLNRDISLLNLMTRLSDTGGV